MKAILKRISFISIMLLILCSFSACGNDGEERIKTGEEHALELEEKADDAVDKVNEDTMKLSETEEDIESE